MRTRPNPRKVREQQFIRADPDADESVDLSFLEELDEDQLREMFQAQKELERRLAVEGPQTDDELHAWLLDELGLDIPRVSVCEDHDAPFTFIADLFFERTEAALLMANRGGSKCGWSQMEIMDADTGEIRTLREVVEDRAHTRIFSLNEDFQLVPQRITGRINSGQQRCLRIMLRSGREIVVTPEHPVLRSDGWVPAEQVVVGDALAAPAHLPFPIDTIALDERHVDLMAIMLAEGGYSCPGTISFSTTDAEILHRASDAAESLGSEVVERKAGVTYGFRGMNRSRRNNIAPWLAEHGLEHLKATQKTIPSCVFRLPEDQLARFLAVFWMCDGYVPKGKAPKMTLASEKMLRQIQHLLLRLGVQSGIVKTRATFDGREFDAWRLSVYSNCIETFFEKIPLWGAKREALEMSLSLSRNPNLGRPPLTREFVAKIASQLDRATWSEKRARAPRVREALGWGHKMPGGAAVLTHGKVRTVGRQRLAALCDEGALGRSGHKHLLSKDLWWDEIVSIEDAGVLDTYDLTMWPRECFIANDIIVHNTFLVALLHWLNSRYKPGCESATFGATEAQSLRAYAHLKNWIYDKEGNKRPEVAMSIMRETTWRNGSRVEVLPGTPAAVNGPHPQKAHADEVELMDQATWSESRNMTVSKRTDDGRLIKPQDIATSTRKGPNGRMQQLIDEIEDAVRKGLQPPRKLYQWCFPPGTPVRTLRGFVPIEDVQEGDIVLSAGGKFRRVTGTHVRHVEHEMVYTIKTPTNPPIMATGEHPFMAVIDERAHDLADKPVNKRTQGYSTDWVDAADLREGAYIESVVPQESMELVEIEPPASTLGNLSDGRRRKAHLAYALTDDFLWAIGLYIAEGHAAQGMISYALHEDECGYAERLRRIFEGFGFKVHFGKTSGRCMSVNVYSTQIAEWWSDWIGSGSANKKIPSEIFTLGLEQLRHVVEGVMDGDGGRSVNTLGQTSPVLAMQMTEVALREGGNPSLHVVPREGKKTVYQLYQADGSVEIAPQYASTPTMERKHKQPRGFWRRDERTFVKVTRHEKTHYCGPVYDLTVEGNPSFVVGNLLVHNCIKETAAQVVNCQVANPDLPEEEKCQCHLIAKGEWEPGRPRLLRDVCNGDFYKSRGWQPYGDVVKQFRENDQETFEVQQLCAKPEMSHHYVPGFSVERYGLRDYFPHPDAGPIFTSVDWGGTNPHSVHWYQLLQYEVEARTFVGGTRRLKEGTIVCFDEIYIAEIGNDKLGDLVIAKENRWKALCQERGIKTEWKVTERFADPQGKAARMDWRDKGLRTQWHTTREFEEHIKVVKSQFEDDLMYVDGVKCPMWVAEIKAWRRDEKTGNQIDEFNHAMSDFRYALANIRKIKRRAMRRGSVPKAKTVQRQSVRVTRHSAGMPEPVGFSSPNEMDRWRQSLGGPETGEMRY